MQQNLDSRSKLDTLCISSRCLRSHASDPSICWISSCGSCQFWPNTALWAPPKSLSTVSLTLAACLVVAGSGRYAQGISSFPGLNLRCPFPLSQHDCCVDLRWSYIDQCLGWQGPGLSSYPGYFWEPIEKWKSMGIPEISKVTSSWQLWVHDPGWPSCHMLHISLCLATYSSAGLRVFSKAHGSCNRFSSSMFPGHAPQHLA